MAIGILDSLGVSNLSLGGIGMWATLLLVFFIIIFIFSIIGGGIILFLWNRSYNQKITLKGRVNGKPQIIATYKGKWIKVAGKHSNEKLLYIRTIQRWENPKLLAGKSHYVFWKREQDGEWINIIDEDVDEKMREMKIKFIDGDVRMQRVANEKVLRDRLQKKKNWMEIIAQVGYIIVFIFLIIGLVVLFMQLKDLSKAMETAGGSIEKMAESVNNFYKGKESLAPNSNTGVLVPVDSGGAS